MSIMSSTTTTADPSSPFSYGPSETAVLLMDYHTHLVNSLPRKPSSTSSITSVGSTEQSQEHPHFVLAANSLLQYARSHSIFILHCLIDINDHPLPTSKLHSRWANYQNVFKSDPEAGLEYYLLRPQPPSSPDSINESNENEMEFKRQPGLISALRSPSLLPLLHTRGIKSLILAGIATGGCVLSTAREASDLGYVVSVLGNGCWDVKEGVHRCLVEDVLGRSCTVFGGVGDIEG